MLQNLTDGIFNFSIRRKLKRTIFYHIDQSNRPNAKFVRETLKFDTIKVEYLLRTAVLYSFEHVVPQRV